MSSRRSVRLSRPCWRQKRGLLSQKSRERLPDGWPDAVERRAAEGAVSPLEARRARVAAVTAVTVLERARRAVLSARARLASTFGG